MNILCATDLLVRSDPALERAGFLADALQAHLTVLHAVPPAAPDGHTLEERLQGATRRMSRRAAASNWRWQSTPELVVQFGQPARLVVDNAQRRDADLVILGPHRGSAFGDAVRGTIAEKVLGASAFPLLVARQPVQGAYRNVLVALDSSPHMGEVVRRVESLGVSGARTTVVHAHEPMYAGMMSTVGVGADATASYVAASRNLAATHIRELLATHSSDPRRYQVTVVERRPASAILGAVERLQPELVVMGTRGYGRFRRALLGSVASDVLRSVQCDVLLVPERDPAKREVRATREAHTLLARI